MSTSVGSFQDLYTGGDYAKKHPDWHLEHSPAKAKDLTPGLLAAVDLAGKSTFRLGDIGAGTGAVLDAAMKVLKTERPKVELEGVGFEISPDAVQLAATHFPHLTVRQKFFEGSDGPFDAVMFVDVLEHVENPWDLLRSARQASATMLVRQPLLDGFSTFRHRNYEHQRTHWGHISYFNFRSFMDMAGACGWKPLKVDLVAPWDLATTPNREGATFLNRSITRWNREMASFILSGFYLNGAFC